MVELTSRERMLRTFRHEEVDRVMMIDSAWAGTIARWKREGLPEGVAWENYFGYDPSMIWFFKQEMAPAADYSGKVYMEEKYRISTSPNGNGGWFLSMKRCGLIDKVHELGIEWLNTFAVDNVLQRIADPVFVGATIASGCACGAKTVRKAERDERVGVMCLKDGRPSIIEYYEMTPELLDAKNENGDPAYNFGVIMNYIFREKCPWEENCLRL